MRAGDRSLPCGCRYVKAGDKWYHVVACPDHELGFEPLDGPDE